jgi:hypothetical protein
MSRPAEPSEGCTIIWRHASKEKSGKLPSFNVGARSCRTSPSCTLRGAGPDREQTGGHQRERAVVIPRPRTAATAVVSSLSLVALISPMEVYSRACDGRAPRRQRLSRTWSMRGCRMAQRRTRDGSWRGDDAGYDADALKQLLGTRSPVEASSPAPPRRPPCLPAIKPSVHRPHGCAAC